MELLDKIGDMRTGWRSVLFVFGLISTGFMVNETLSKYLQQPEITTQQAEWIDSHRSTHSTLDSTVSSLDRRLRVVDGVSREADQQLDSVFTALRSVQAQIGKLDSKMDYVLCNRDTSMSFERCVRELNGNHE